jgi:carbon storage regulator CsrA
MLVIHRKVGERIVLSGGIEVSVVSSSRGGVRLAVIAPKEVFISRGEVHDAVAFSNAAAAATRASLFPTTLGSSPQPCAPEEPQ